MCSTFSHIQFVKSTLIKKKIEFSSYMIGCKVIYDKRPPHIWLNTFAFPHILGSSSSRPRYLALGRFPARGKPPRPCPCICFTLEAAIPCTRPFPCKRKTSKAVSVHPLHFRGRFPDQSALSRLLPSTRCIHLRGHCLARGSKILLCIEAASFNDQQMKDKFTYLHYM